MILLLVLGISILVGLVRGGRLSNLAALPLRWPAVPVLALAAQSLVILFPQSRGQGLLSLHSLLLMLSYLALLVTIWVNRGIPGMVLLCLGLLLNLTVMLLNGGYMPITPDAVKRIGATGYTVENGTGARVGYSKDVVLPREGTHLWLFSDIFVIPPPFPIPTAFSLGDVLASAGMFLLLQYALLRVPSPPTTPEASRN